MDLPVASSSVSCRPNGSARPTRPAIPAAREAGFTLAEVTVTLILLVEIALAMLLLFDASSKLGKAEMQVADMQQSLRIGQYEIVKMVRMAGRGGLPVANNPQGPTSPFAANLFAGTAIGVRNNVAANQGIIAGAAPTDPPTPLTNPRVVAGTDVLTIRGVFSNPIYQLNPANPAGFAYNAASGQGAVTVTSVSPTGVTQAFDSTNAPGSFADAIAQGRKEALILVSPVDDTIYGVAELIPNQSSIVTNADGTQTASLAFTTVSPVASLSANGAWGSPATPPTLSNAEFVGILEEYRYYIRDVRAQPTVQTSELNPVLSRARFYAGTNNPWDTNPTNLYQDIAEGVLDLQVALAFDLPTPGSNPPTPDGVITEGSPPSKTDEVLFNSPADDATDPMWNPVPFPQLLWVRVNVLARTNRHDVQYQAPKIVSIEDHVYNTTPATPWDPNGAYELNMRRRWVQTVVALRNRL